MKSLRMIAGILNPLTKIVAMVYTVVTLYAIVVIMLSLISPGAAYVPIGTGGGKFEIYLPFTKTAFLLGDYTSAYLVPMLMIICFYSLFFWLLSGVFSAFKQKKLFVPKGVRQLSRFYISNLTIPILILIAAIFYNMGAQDMLMITVLHGVLGVFAYFMAAIFKEGLLLQEEQDLTL